VDFRCTNSYYVDDNDERERVAASRDSATGVRTSIPHVHAVCAEVFSDPPDPGPLGPERTKKNEANAMSVSVDANGTVAYLFNGASSPLACTTDLDCPGSAVCTKDPTMWVSAIPSGMCACFACRTHSQRTNSINARARAHVCVCM